MRERNGEWEDWLVSSRASAGACVVREDAGWKRASCSVSVLRGPAFLPAVEDQVGLPRNVSARSHFQRVMFWFVKVNLCSAVDLYDFGLIRIVATAVTQT